MAANDRYRKSLEDARAGRIYAPESDTYQSSLAEVRQSSTLEALADRVAQRNAAQRAAMEAQNAQRIAYDQQRRAQLQRQQADITAFNNRANILNTMNADANARIRQKQEELWRKDAANALRVQLASNPNQAARRRSVGVTQSQQTEPVSVTNRAPRENRTAFANQRRQTMQEKEEQYRQNVIVPRENRVSARRMQMNMDPFAEEVISEGRSIGLPDLSDQNMDLNRILLSLDDNQKREAYYLMGKYGGSGYLSQELLDYLQSIQTDVLARDAQEQRDQIRSFSQEHPVIGAGASILMSNVGGPLGMAQGAVDLVEHQISGKPVDPNSSAYLPSQISTAAREGSGTAAATAAGNMGRNWAQSINSRGGINGKQLNEDDVANAFANVGQFMSGTAIDAANSLIVSGIPGGATIMGLSAGGNVLTESLQEGSTIEQAFLNAAVQGYFEGLFERYTIGNLKKFKEAENSKQILYRWAMSMLSNGAEEFNTEIADGIADYIIMADESELAQSVQKHMAEGDDEKTAWVKAYKELAGRAGLAMLGGFVSAGMSGAAAGGARQVELMGYGGNIQTADDARAYSAVLGSESRYLDENGQVDQEAHQRGLEAQRTLDSIAERMEQGRSVGRAERGQAYVDAVDTLYAQADLQRRNQNARNEAAESLRNAIAEGTDETAARERAAQLMDEDQIRNVQRGGINKAFDQGDTHGRAEEEVIDARKSIYEDRGYQNVANVFEETYKKGSTDLAAFDRAARELSNATFEDEQTGGDRSGALMDQFVSQGILTADQATDIIRATVQDSEDLKKTLLSEISNYGSSMSEAGQQALLANYSGNSVSPEQYVPAFHTFYDAGLTGQDIATPQQDISAIYLTQAQQQAAYAAGQQAAAEAPGVTYTQGEAREGGLGENISKNTKGELQETGRILGEKTGLRFNFTDTSVSEYDGKTGNINIGLQSKNLLQSISHELSHFLRDYDPEGYGRFQQRAIAAMMRSRNMSYQLLYQQYEKAYSEEYGRVDRAAIIEEITADATGLIMNDEAFAKKMARKDRTFTQKIADFFSDICDAIRGLISGEGIRTASKVLHEDLAAFEEARDIWMNALETASERYKSGQTVEGNTLTKYDLNIKGDKLNPRNVTLDETKTMLQHVRQGDYKRRTFIPMLNHTPQAAILAVKNAKADGVEIVGELKDYPLIGGVGHLMDIMEESSPDDTGDFHAHNMDEEDIVEILGKLDRVPEIYYQKSNGNIAIIIPHNNKRYLIPIAFIDKLHGKEENSRTVHQMNDYSGGVYNIVVTVFDHERQRYKDYIANENNVNITQYKEASRSEPGGILTPLYSNDASNKSISTSDPKGNGLEDLKTKKQLDLGEPVEQTKNLLAIHNMDPYKLRQALQYEGLPMPSIAITTADIGHENFGPISFVFRKDTIDPKNRKNKVYSADAWTPTFPRIEFTANEKAEKRLRDKFYALEQEYGRDAADALYNYGVVLEDSLNRYGGAEGIIEKELDNPNMAKAYLYDTGKADSIPQPETTVVETRSPIKGRELLDYMISHLGEEAVLDDETPLSAFRDLHEAYMREVLHYPAEEASNKVDRNPSAIYERLVERAQALVRGETEVVNRQTKTDTSKRDAYFRETLKTKEYKDWLTDLLRDVEGAKGIWNGKDTFTASGNRRSFSSTHYDVTAANIVKAMLAQNGGKSQNTSGFIAGIKSVRSSAAVQFRTLDEIRKAAQSLGTTDTEEYNALSEQLSDMMYQILSELKKDPNSFFETNTLGEILIEAIEQKKTSPDAIRKKYYEYKYVISDLQAQKLSKLVEDVKAMPVDMFEAKPERVVGWDEVAAAVVPNTLEESLRQDLQEKGIPVMEYDPEVEGDRKEKVNSLNDVRFQLDISDDTARAYGLLLESSPELQEASRKLSSMFNRTDYLPDPSDIKKIAAELRKKTGSTMKSSDLQDKLRTFYNWIHNADQLDGVEVMQTAMDLAEQVIKDSNYGYNEQEVKEYRELRSLLRESKDKPIYVSDAMLAELGAEDDYKDLRRAVWGTMFLTRDSSKGRSMDDFYQNVLKDSSLASRFTAANEGDQLRDILEKMETMKPRQQIEGTDFETYVLETAQEIFDAYFNTEYNPEGIALTQYRNAAAKAIEQYKERTDRSLKELYERKRNNEQMKKFESAARQKLLKQARALRRMKGRPEFEAAKQDLINNLDLVATGIRSDTRAKLEQLREQVHQQAAADPDYAASELPRYDALFERLKKIQIADMSIEEINALTEQIVALKHSEETAQRQIRDEQGRLNAERGRKLRDEQSKIKGIDYSKWWAGLKKLELLSLNPVRAMHVLDGYRPNGELTQFAQEFNDGQTRMNMWIMNAQKMFDEVLNDKEAMKDWSKQNIEIKNFQGRRALISKGMRVSIYLHSLNQANKDHIFGGGLVIPNAKLYAKGDSANAYNLEDNIRFTQTDLDNIISQMTEGEKRYAAVAKKFFNVTTKNAINEVSLLLNGYEKATVANYFPIKTDSNFNARDISALVQDGTLEGSGWLKERKGSRMPIILEDVSRVVMRQMESTGRYYGFAIPVRNFNKVYNYTATGWEGAAAKSIAKTWGTSGQDYISKWISDVQTGGRKGNSALDKVFSRAKGHYAEAVLNHNLSVAIKQSASAPMAAAVLDTKSVAKAFSAKLFSKADYDYMDTITPWSYMRRQGMSGTEMGEIAQPKTDVQRALENNSAYGKVKQFLNWIQNVDVWTTDRLFFATEYYVQDHFPDLEVRGEEYNKKVAELYNDMLQRTQPSYDIMQRPEALRDPGNLMKALTMFKTQTFNMGGEVIDAGHRLWSYQQMAKAGDINQKQLTEAKRQFGKSVMATLASQAMLAVLTAAANAALHKMKRYRDPDGEVTMASAAARILKDFLQSFGGLFLGGSELQSLILAIMGEENWYDITLPGLDSINEMASGVVQWTNALEAMFEEPSEKNKAKVMKHSWTIAKAAGMVKGLPISNDYNILNSIYLWYQDFKDPEMEIFESGSGLFGLSDTSVSAKEYAQRAVSAYSSGDTRKGDIAAARASQTQLQNAIGAESDKDENGDTIDGSKEKNALDQIIAYNPGAEEQNAGGKVSLYLAAYPKKKEYYDLWKKAGGKDWDFLVHMRNIMRIQQSASGKDKQKMVSAYIKKQGGTTAQKQAMWQMAGYKLSTYK